MWGNLHFFRTLQHQYSGLVASLKGEYEHSIDEKGRVSFPAKLRKYIADDRFTILRGLEKCLYLYPQEQWEKVEEHLSAVNSFSQEGRLINRQFLRTAEDVALDGQNRIALPAKLSEWAGISNRVIFIGAGDKIELWSPENLDAQDQNLDFESYQALFEKVMGDGGQK